MKGCDKVSSMAIVILYLLYCYWERNVCLNINILKCLVPNKTKIIKFQPLEVVGRGSETQLQVGENLNKMTSRFKC